MSCVVVVPCATGRPCRMPRRALCNGYAGCTACVHHRCPNGFLAHACPAALLQTGADFEVVNVLDDVYNPGLRDAIKTYSAWPTIPQARPAVCCRVRHHHLPARLGGWCWRVQCGQRAEPGSRWVLQQLYRARPAGLVSRAPSLPRREAAC